MRKKIFLEDFSLIGSGKPKEALRLFEHECQTHNPYNPVGLNKLTVFRS
jgi:hypothetical protein